MLRIKRVHSESLRDEVFALRYRAYRHENAIAESAAGRFRDDYDEQPNHVLWALTEHGKIVGSIRSTWYEPDAPWRIPEMDGYAEEVGRVVPAGSRMLSGNRFVTCPERARHGSLYSMWLLRHHMLVADARADFALAAVRRNHLSFYRRVLRLERVSEERIYPGLTAMMYLTACHFPKHIKRVYSHTPRIRPRGYERMLLDDGYRDLWETGLPIEP